MPGDSQLPGKLNVWLSIMQPSPYMNNNYRDPKDQQEEVAEETASDEVTEE